MNLRRRRILLVALVPLIIAAALSGCARKQATGRIELTLFTWVPPEELTANQELIGEFERQHPDLHVTILNEPSQRAMDKLQTSIAAGNPPDVMSIHGAYFLPLAAKGALLDLEPLIAGDAQFDLGDFYPQILPICRYEGKLYSLPRYASVYVLFYNKDLFDEVGVAYPSDGWTWDDYLTAAKKLTRHSSDPDRARYGCIIDFWGARIYPWIWQNDGQILDESRRRCLLDQRPAEEALQFLVDLARKHKVAPVISQEEARETREWFKAGRVAMFMSGAWDVQVLRRSPSLRWDVAPLPKRKQRATLAGTENYAISAKTAHPKESWELFTFLLSPKSQETMAAAVEKQPSRISVAEGPYLAAKVGYNRRVFVDALGYGKLAPNVPEWDRISHLIQDRLDQIWIGQITVAQGMQQAAADVTRELEAAAR
jgi:multiple sugar transport system substrate-binding protein